MENYNSHASSDPMAGVATTDTHPHATGEHTPQTYLVLSSRINYSQTKQQLVLQLSMRKCGDESWPLIRSFPIRRGTLLFYAISQAAKKGMPPPPTNVADTVTHVNVVKSITAAAGIVNPIVHYDGDCGWTDRNAAISLVRSSNAPIFGERAHTVRVEYDYAETMSKLNGNPSNPTALSTARIVNRMRGHLANMHAPDTSVGAPILDAPASAFHWRFINQSNNFQCPLTLLDLENYHLHRCPALNAPFILAASPEDLLSLSFDSIFDAFTWLNDRTYFKDSPDEYLLAVTREVRVVSLDVATPCLASHDECIAATTGFIVPPHVVHQKHEGGSEYAGKGIIGQHCWDLCSSTPCDVISIIGPNDSYRELLMMKWKTSIGLLFDLHANEQGPLVTGVNQNIPNAPVLMFDYAQVRELFLNHTWYWATHNVPMPQLTHKFLEEKKLVRLALEIAIDLKLDLQQVLASSRLSLAKSIVDRIMSDAEMLPSHFALDFNYQCVIAGRARQANTNAFGKRSYESIRTGPIPEEASEILPALTDGALESGAHEAGYRGGLVLPAKPGIYTGTTEFDFDSHYASIMVEYSHFYAAANPDDNVRLLACFKQQISSWIAKKRYYKSQPDKADLSYALKLKNNILYGCIGRQGNNVLANTALAAEITAHGRSLLQRAMRTVPSLDSVLMGHTDALFVANSSENWKSQCEAICAKVNEGFSCVKLRVARQYRWSWVLNKTRHISVMESVDSLETMLTIMLRAALKLIESPSTSLDNDDEEAMALNIETLEMSPTEWRRHERFEPVVTYLKQHFVFPGLLVRDMPMAVQAITLFSTLTTLALWIYESIGDHQSQSLVDTTSLFKLFESRTEIHAILKNKRDKLTLPEKMNLILCVLNILFEHGFTHLEDWIHWIESPSTSINVTHVTRNDGNYRHYIKTCLRNADEATINATTPHEIKRTIANQRFLPVMRSRDTRNYEPVSFGITKDSDVDQLWWKRRVFGTLDRHLINTPNMSDAFRSQSRLILSRVVLGKEEHERLSKSKRVDDAMDIDDVDANVPSDIIQANYISSNTPLSASAVASHKAAIHKIESLWAELMTVVAGASEQWNALPNAKRVAERLLAANAYGITPILAPSTARNLSIIPSNGTIENGWLERFFLPFAVKHPNAIGNQDALRDYTCARVLERYDFEGAIAQQTQTTELFEATWRRADVRQHAEAFRRGLAAAQAVLTKIFFVS